MPRVQRLECIEHPPNSRAIEQARQAARCMSVKPKYRHFCIPNPKPPNMALLTRRSVLISDYARSAVSESSTCEAIPLQLQTRRDRCLLSFEPQHHLADSVNRTVVVRWGRAVQRRGPETGRVREVVDGHLTPTVSEVAGGVSSRRLPARFYTDEKAKIRAYVRRSGSLRALRFGVSVTGTTAECSAKSWYDISRLQFIF